MEDIEKQLKKQAQILGDLNLELNKYVEQNQKLSLDIVKLEQRVAKKVVDVICQKKIIDQESKDKAIIHEKLVKAEQKKQKLEIEFGDSKHKEQKQQLKSVQQQIKRPQSLNKAMKKQQKDDKEDQVQQNTMEYVNSLKGQYEPPVLLIPYGQGENSNSSQQQNQEHDDETLLQSVRKKLQNLKNQDEENQDNNEG